MSPLTMFCEHCGTAINAESKFCTTCGSEIQVIGKSSRTSQRKFAGDRSRRSARKLQAILLNSIPAVLLVIIVAWLTIPGAFQNTTMRGRQPEEQSAPDFNARIADPLSPSDSDVRRILNRTPTGCPAILLGYAVVTSGPTNVERKEISADAFKEVAAWSQVGLIDLTTDELLPDSERFKGYLKRIKVAPTAKGLEFQKDCKFAQPRDPKFLYARFYTAMFTDIIENREVKKNVELYRVVKATHKWRYNEVGAKVFSILSTPMIDQENVIVLLKHDSFKKQWDFVTSDWTAAGKQFKSNNVESYLAAH